MLTQLTINQFAIVHQLTIEFQQGMSVITGETGAGKSIALDALGICLGQRTDSTMLRLHDQRAEVCAEFNVSHNTAAKNWLNEQSLQDVDNAEHCILRRVISPDGRSKAFINSTPVPAALLKQLGNLLVQINGQHCSQQLLKTDHQMYLLDQYCDNHDLLQKLQNQHAHWKNLQHQVQTFQQKCAENAAKKQLLEYQVAELDEFDLKAGEFEILEQDHLRLSNTETLTMLSQSALQLLSENEDVNISTLLSRSHQHINELIDLDERYQGVSTLLQEALIQIDEAVSELQHLSASIEQEPELLVEVEQRLSQAIHLARKHNVNPENLPTIHHQLKTELAALVDFSQSEETLIQAEQLAHSNVLDTAQQLHERRQAGAKHLADEVTRSIQMLAMEKAIFVIDVNFQAEKLQKTGADSVQFLLSANLGQVPQALNKVASGGELSRIALTLQVLTSSRNAIPTLIFDEIDVGISGATANVVGKLLRTLGDTAQVICVTHLPQVASCGHHHYIVEKRIIDDHIQTSMQKLSQQNRVQALAKLLAGTEITESVLANAQEMLALAS